MNLGLGIGPGKRRALDYYLEVLNGLLKNFVGRNFTEGTISVSADALQFLHNIKKAVQQDISGL